MAAFISGDVLRCLEKLTLAPEDATSEAQSHIHVRPSPENENRTLIEVTSGRCVVWVQSKEASDDARLVPKAHAKRFGKGETATIIDGEVRSPFHVSLPRAVEDGADPAEGEIQYPVLDAYRPASDARLALSLDPKRTAALMTVLAGLCSGSVDLLLPTRRGGPVSFRGTSAMGETVEATLLAENLFGLAAADMPEDGDEKPARAPLFEGWA